ncbi:YdcF family protein [Clostridium psychrophilum]|uniref:YdcF family protein n=1 Tax=Clostridium psychrophilum TaxID=132926 RepID=UPI001C0C194B|nr:YdcF family protein [Clostridium psychrophilum]MBU3183125.1 YdcF family protein [Clostridium psychrophilum]
MPPLVESLAFSKKVMESKRFKTAVVVSNKYHLKRVSLMSKRLKMNTSYSGIFVSKYKFNEYTGYVREVFGVIKFLILKK